MVHYNSAYLKKSINQIYFRRKEKYKETDDK